MYTPSVHHCVYEMCVLVINLSVIFSLKCTGNRISKYEQDVISDEQTNGGWGPQYWVVFMSGLITGCSFVRVVLTDYFCNETVRLSDSIKTNDHCWNQCVSLCSRHTLLSDITNDVKKIYPCDRCQNMLWWSTEVREWKLGNVLFEVFLLWKNVNLQSGSTFCLVRVSMKSICAFISAWIS